VRYYAGVFVCQTEGIMSGLILPKFTDEDEEAKWWFDNQDVVDAEFIKAAKEGRLRIGSVRARLEGREPEFLPPMQIDDNGSPE
jgi:hypothetical protein